MKKKVDAKWLRRFHSAVIRHCGTDDVAVIAGELKESRDFKASIEQLCQTVRDIQASQLFR